MKIGSFEFLFVLEQGARYSLSNCLESELSPRGNGEDNSSYYEEKNRQ